MKAYGLRRYGQANEGHKNCPVCNGKIARIDRSNQADRKVDRKRARRVKLEA